MAKPINKIHNWTILKKIRKHEHNYVLAQCKCGTIHEVRLYHIEAGDSKQCRKCGNTRHNQSDTKLFGIWQNLFTRCYNKNSSRYRWYGGRGITMCQDWYTFVPFKEWAESSNYSDTLTIDRINNNGNYEPDNCRWITNAENTNSYAWLRDNNGCIYRGFKVLAEELGMNMSTVSHKVRKKQPINGVIYNYCDPVKYV